MIKVILILFFKIAVPGATISCGTADPKSTLPISNGEYSKGPSSLLSQKGNVYVNDWLYIAKIT